MRVCHISKDWAKASGVHTFVTQLDRALLLAGVESVVVKRLSDYIKEYKKSPDLVHIHGLWVNNADFILAKRRKIKVVWSTHGMTAPWAMRFKWLKKCLPWYLMQRWELKYSDCIHNASEQEKNWNEAYGFDRNVVIPVGTDIRDARQIGGQLGAKEHQLLFVGRIHPVKNVDSLVRAFAMVPNELRAHWRLAIVGPGDGSYLAELKGMAYALDIESVVDFNGPAYGAELSACYNRCDCLALVSHTENFGATVVEAMAAGRPVITSKDTPWEIVAQRGCGWWVDGTVEGLATTLSKMMSLLPEERELMGRRGRQLVTERYTWTAVGRAMIEAYKEVLRED